MLKSRAQSRSPRARKLARLNVERLESRVLLSGHGFSGPHFHGFDAIAPQDNAAEHADLPGAQLEQNGDFAHGGDTSAFYVTLPPAGTSDDASTSVQSTHDVVVIETVVVVQSTDSRLTDSWDLRPDVQRPDPAPTSSMGYGGENDPGNTTAGQLDASKPSGASNQGANTGQPVVPAPVIGVDQGPDGSITIVVNNSPTLRHFVLHPDGGAPAPGQAFGDAGTERLTLPPAGTPISQPTPASAQPAVVAAPATPKPPASPASVPVVTPLAITPARVSDAVQPPATSAGPAATVVAAAAPHTAPIGGISDVPQGTDHAIGHWPVTIGFALPSLPQTQELAVAASNVVELATGSVNITGTVAQQASDLITTEMTAQSLPAVAAYNFIHFDAAAFHDAVSVFANELASMTGTGKTKHSTARAWMITGSVIAFDAAFLGYWYRKGKREKKRTMMNAE